MKKIFASAMIFTVGLVMAQTDAYKGVGDIKVNLGANLQDGGTGIISSVDYGLGESFSIGAQAGYLLGVKEIGGEIPKFGDRFDLKVRLKQTPDDLTQAILVTMEMALKDIAEQYPQRVRIKEHRR